MIGGRYLLSRVAENRVPKPGVDATKMESKWDKSSNDVMRMALVVVASLKNWL